MEMLITVLVSAVSTLVIGYIIWLIIEVHKLRKQNKEQIEFNSNILNELEIIRNNYDDEINEFKKTYWNFYELEYQPFFENYDKNDKNLRKEIDRRFDKVYKLLKDVKIVNIDNVLEEYKTK